MGKFCSFYFCACPLISLWYYNFNSCNCSICNLSLVFGCLQEIKVIIILSITNKQFLLYVVFFVLMMLSFCFVNVLCKMVDKFITVVHESMSCPFTIYMH
jgi:hypothetical protein